MLPHVNRSILLRGAVYRGVAPLCLRSAYSNKGPIQDDVVDRIGITPLQRSNETIDKKRSRLLYQSRKRGILETDLLLSSFAAKYLKNFKIDELDEYDALLNELDWDIYYWATKNYKITPVPPRWKDSKTLSLLQDFAENKDKQILRMPDLDKY